MRRSSSRPAWGSLWFGLGLGLVLETINIMTGGFSTYLPGGFRFHHIWLGLGLAGVGFYARAPFLIGLGLVLALGDLYEHYKPDGTFAPFW